MQMDKNYISSCAGAGVEFCTDPNQLWLLDHIRTHKYEHAICATQIDIEFYANYNSGTWTCLKQTEQKHKIHIIHYLNT